MQLELLNKSKRNGLVILFSGLILYLNWLYLQQRDELLKQEVKISLAKPAKDSLRTTMNHQFVTKNVKKPKYKPTQRRNSDAATAELIEPRWVKKRDSFHRYNAFPERPKFTPRTSRSIQSIDINVADEDAWESLPGIGPYYAKIIMNYRQKLGGFTQKEQIKETWNFPDSVYQKAEPFFTVSAGGIRQINLNTCELSDLAAHPYLSVQEARAIINYRFQHGKFEQIKDLQNIRRLDKSTLDKIFPYLTIESGDAVQL